MQPWQQKSSWSHILNSVDSHKIIGTRDEYSTAKGRPATPRDFEIFGALLQQGIGSTNQMAAYTKQNFELSASVRQLRDVLHLLLSNSGEWSEEAQFQTAYPLVKIMTAIPISFIQINQTNPTVLLTLAHVFAVVVLLAMRFPCLDIPTFAQVYVKSVLELNEIIPRTGRSYTCSGSEMNHNVSTCMAFPLAVINVYQHEQLTTIRTEDLQESSASLETPSPCDSEEVPVRFMEIPSGSG